MSRFKLEDCAIPTVWCGDSDDVPDDNSKDGVKTKYVRKGTTTECLRKGFGAGQATEKSKSLPATSLQKIKYVGDKHEAAFKKAGIKTTTELVTKMKGKTDKEIEKALKKILKKSNGVVDGRAYNCVLVYLHGRGVKKLPACTKLKL
jgi:hypothetical protein